MSLRRPFSRLILASAVLSLAFSANSYAWEGTPNSGTSVTIRIEIGDRSELEHLTRLVSIDDVRGHDVRAVATPEQREALSAAGWSWQFVPATAKTAALTMCDGGWVEDDDRSWACYPSYQQYEALMQKYATDHPDLCRLVDLGPTANLVRPHRLMALIVSDYPGDDEAEPEVLLTASMHCDEFSGFVLMLRLIDELTREYSHDPAIRALVDDTELWINPLANPDGAYFGGDDSVADAIRFYTTSSGADSRVDPNRNFPDFDDGDHPHGNPWWPETEAMMALAEAKTFVLSANFHDRAEVVNYPWDTVGRRHPDDLWFRALARDWADLAQADSPAGYLTDLDNGITRGWEWYTIAGGRQDFMTFFHGGREVTVELSRTNPFPAEVLDELWSWNRSALLDFIAHAHEGIWGVVTDANGRPLEAAVEVLGVDREEDGSMARTDPAVGDYHRLLLPGLYDLKIEATDFQSRVIYGIAVAEGEATRVDVVLHRAIRRPSRRVSTDPVKAARTRQE